MSTPSTPGVASSALLQVRDLSIAFRTRGQEHLVMDRVGFDLERGRTLGMVGESGSGKSVTCLALLGLLPRPQARVVQGTAWYDGLDLLAQSERRLQTLRGNRISFVFQDPLAALNPYLTIGAQLAEPLRVHRGVSRYEAHQRTLDALAEVGIREPQRRIHDYPHQFSGGMRQRVMIAMALITQPDMLIADEPTTALDVTVQAQILALLRDLQQRHGMAMIFVSHDLRLVSGIADQVLVMQAGRCVETGQTRAIFTAPQAGYTRRLLDAMPQGRKPPAAPGLDPSAVPLLCVEHLGVTYADRGTWFGKAPGPIAAVADVSLEIRPGEILGVVGETGSGKSTLARAIVRLEIPDTGRVRLSQKNWSELDPPSVRLARRQVQMVFQDPYSSLNPRMTVHDCLAEALTLRRKLPPQELQEAIERLLADVGLEASAAHRYPHEFSGGQRQRIAIARALAPEPDLLIADEPVSALDVTIQGQILELLLALNRDRGLALLFISHDLSVIGYIADRVAVLYRGRVVELADTDTLFARPVHDYTRALLAAMPAALEPAPASAWRPQNSDFIAGMPE